MTCKVKKEVNNEGNTEEAMEFDDGQILAEE